jgi:hypothetical protein
MRRPLASWVGPPKEALIAPPGLVGGPHTGVGIPRGLPLSLGFGTLNPSVTTGGRFTGASVPGAQNMVHPEPPPTFQAPIYGPLSGATNIGTFHPVVSAILTALAGGGTPGGGGTPMGPLGPGAYGPPGSAPGYGTGTSTFVPGTYGPPGAGGGGTGPSTFSPMSTPTTSSLLAALAKSGGRTARI